VRARRCKNSNPNPPLMLAINAAPNHHTSPFVNSLGEIGPMTPAITIATIASPVPIRTGRIAFESDAVIGED